MRVIELSNHPGDMLADVSRRRHAADNRAQDQYEDALIRHQARVQTIRVQRDRARQQRQWWTWLRLTFAVWAEQRRAPAKPVPDTGDIDTEEKIRAGIAGEQLVATDLGRALADDWTLLRGVPQPARRDRPSAPGPQRAVRHRGEEHQRHRVRRRRPLAGRQV